MGPIVQVRIEVSELDYGVSSSLVVMLSRGILSVRYGDLTAESPDSTSSLPSGLELSPVLKPVRRNIASREFLSLEVTLSLLPSPQTCPRLSLKRL